MLTKVYSLLWLAVAVLMGVTYATGNMTSKVLVVFGFIIFGLIFMGMISVLPFWATHHTSVKH
jgi:hypothetical protein